MQKASGPADSLHKCGPDGPTVHSCCLVALCIDVKLTPSNPAPLPLWLQILMGALKLFMGPKASKAKRGRQAAPGPAGPDAAAVPAAAAGDRKEL